ncbi:MAG: hypothetical protein ABIY70_17525 [Capsulimonas sp.]|uniref:hypothetical protein n=1 Tax=Capsulimonas sp. TaxID=2494211 RepID=UPI0032667C74
MKDTSIDKYVLKFTIRDAYYPEAQMSWQFPVSLLYTELFSECPKVRSKPGVSIDADNIDQLCFDLSEEYEIKYIEYIGFRFQFDDRLTAPSPTRRGNLILANPLTQLEAEQTLRLYSLDHPMDLICTSDRTLARIGIDTLPITDVVAASSHVRYTLSGDALQEIWLVSPSVYYQ